jgi:ribosomal protein S12 methylthiotransferase
METIELGGKKFFDKTLYFASLGCSKNLVDAQVMLGNLGMAGLNVVTDPEKAEVIVVNTCAFVDSAKDESISTILEMTDFKDPQKGKCQALVVSGCLGQRYSKELEAEMPEVDLFIGTGEYNKIAHFLKAFEEGALNQKSFVEIPRYIHTEFDPRINTSPGYMAYLKVSEGCNRNCTFCIIPTLRGRLRSRSVQSLVKEAENLVAQGVKEINIISQDLSDYGVDLGEGQDLLNLLEGLEKIPDLVWIRLFYYYPENLSDQIMEQIRNSQKICHYLDMPVQHFSDKILKKMNRKTTGHEINLKIDRLRKYIPDIVLRTSVIVGFPGETEEDFENLLAGIKRNEFDHLGVFRYSDEEGTAALRLKDKIPQDIIEKRFKKVYDLQKKIVRKKNKKLIGKTLRVLVEGPHEETGMLLQGRYQGQGPDIDGKVIINDGVVSSGQFVNVLIEDAFDYDLVGGIQNEIEIETENEFERSDLLEIEGGEKIHWA